MRFMNLPKILVNRIAVAQTHDRYTTAKIKQLEHTKHAKRDLMGQSSKTVEYLPFTRLRSDRENRRRASS